MEEEQEISVDDILEETRGPNAQPLPHHMPSPDDHDDPAGPPDDYDSSTTLGHSDTDDEVDETARYQGGDPSAGDS